MRRRLKASAGGSGKATVCVARKDDLAQASWGLNLLGSAAACRMAGRGGKERGHLTCLSTVGGFV